MLYRRTWTLSLSSMFSLASCNKRRLEISFSRIPLRIRILINTPKCSQLLFVVEQRWCVCYSLILQLTKFTPLDSNTFFLKPTRCLHYILYRFFANNTYFLAAKKQLYRINLRAPLNFLKLKNVDLDYCELFCTNIGEKFYSYLEVKLTWARCTSVNYIISRQ